MNKPIERETVEEVLDAYVASTDEPGSSSSLAPWIQLYPHFKRELMDFAASWSRAKWLSPDPADIDVDEERLVLRGMSILQNLLHTKQQQRSSEASQAPLVSLLEEAKRLGLSAQGLADSVGLGRMTLRKLDRRLIRFAQIPPQLLTALSDSLSRSVSDIALYLQGPPRLAGGARYRADQAPSLTEQVGFFHAIRTDRTMSDEQRGRWLDLDPDSDLQDEGPPT